MLGESSDIIEVVEALFSAGTTKDMSRLWEIHLDDDRFSSFSDFPPYDLKGYRATIELEELRFISISDYSCEVRAPKISVYGDVAVVAAEIVQTGMLVNNKAFTGKRIKINGRATFVMVKKPTWKIAHMHLSQIDGR